MEVDNVSPPSSVYDAVFGEKTASLNYPFEFDDYATLTFVGVRTDSSPSCIASFVIDATPDAVVKKREQMDITLTATVVFPTNLSLFQEGSSILGSNDITTNYPSISSTADYSVASDAQETPQYYDTYTTTTVYTTEKITTICSDKLCTSTYIVTVITTDCPVVCRNGDCTTIISTSSQSAADTVPVTETITNTVTSCEDKKCHEFESASVITTDSESECSDSETASCKIKSYATETDTYTSTKLVSVIITKNGKTVDSTIYTTALTTVTTTTPPVESPLSSVTSPSMGTIVSTLEGAGNKMYPSFRFSLGFLLSIMFSI
ncbi:unnamed protein product [[Candida] boidinii]|nr:unnamed protein product [[Candida] boidinii]